MSSKPSISIKAFDTAIPSVLTNEIPHISIYNILNRQLKNKWSSELIGRTQVQYGQDFESQKVMNGILAKDTYSARRLTFTDPKENKIYDATFEKINFSIDGAFETEIDYLMHEHARYLSKLYPDDFNTLITLTEAERQSYINEALHMVHSYFDTEQIADLDLQGTSKTAADFYYRLRFLEGITPIRSLTGVAYQEECLLNLLKTIGSSKVFFGFSNYSSPDSISVVSNTEKLKYLEDSLSLEAYKFVSEDYLIQKGILRIHGKSRNDTLEDLLANVHKTVPLNKDTFEEIGKEYTVINSTDPIELLDDLIYGKGINTNSFCLNDLFLQATKENLIKIDSSLEALKLTDFGKRLLDWNSDQTVFPVLSYDTTAKEIVLLDSKELVLKNLGNLEDKLLVTTDARLSTLDTSNLIKLGKSNFTKTVLLGLGNVLMSSLTRNYVLNEEFQTILDTTIANKSLVMVADIYQDGRRVAGGIVNTSYIKTFNLRKIVSNYSFEAFVPEYSLELLLEKQSFKNQLQKLDFDISKKFDIRYRITFLSQDFFLENATYLEAQLGIEDDKVSDVLIYRTFDDAVDIIFDDYRGNSRTGKILSTKDTNINVGTVIFKENRLTIHIDATDKTFEYTLPDTNSLSLDNLVVYDGDKQQVGRCVIGNINEENFVDLDNLSRFGEVSQHKKILGNMIDLDFNYRHEISNDTAKLSENDASANTLEIEILYYETLQEALEANAISFTNTTYDNVDDTASYIYSTAYKLANNYYLVPASILDAVSVANLLFQPKDTEYFLLKTCKCEVYAEDILRSNEDITTLISEHGRLNCLFLDNFGNFHASRVKKAKLKNDYCYITLESKLGKDIPVDAKDGLLVLDIGTRASISTEESSADKKRREYNFKQTYRYDDNLKFYREVSFEELTRQHLKYDFDNIYSKTVKKTYADDSPVSKATQVPISLAYYESLTVLDSDSNLDLCQSLLQENKSLYLDSALKVISNPALETKVLTRSKDYGTISYTYSSGVPATIDFYSFSDYSSYKPLEDFLKELEGAQEKVDLPDLETLVARRIVVWGNVVWDANNVNKTVRTLRTIWAGYFTNFRITATDDILPPEEFVISQDFESNSGNKHVNICNYNYAENYGAAAADWILATVLDSNKQQTQIINVCDAYSHKSEEDTEKNLTIEAGKEILIYTFELTANRFDTSKSSEATSLATLNEDLSSILIDTNLQIRTISENVKPKFNYDPLNNQYTLTTAFGVPEYTEYATNTDYDLKLSYGMIHLYNENFGALGFMDTVTKNIGTQMLLEIFVANYMEMHCKTFADLDAIKTAMRKAFKTFTEQQIDFYIELFAKSDSYKVDWETSDKSLKITDILDYTYNFYLASKTIPCVACLMPDGKLRIFYCMLGRSADRKNYYIYKGSFVETINGDLLNSLTFDISKNFQLPARIYNQYLSSIFKYQYNLPNKASGLPNDIAIDIGINVKSDTNSFEIADRKNVKNKKTFLKKNISEKTLVPETTGKEEYGIANANVEDSLKDSINRIFPDVQLSKLSVDRAAISLSDHKYRIAQNDEYFREYYPTTVQLSTKQVEALDADIDACTVTFDKDLNLKSEGFLYLTDIKAPNRRSNYATSRETQILDRYCTLSNLHIIGYQQKDDNLKLLLQDSSTSYTRFVENGVSLVRPKDNTKDNQECVNENVSIGFHWADPGLEIGYTFYKRKFVFEGVIDSSDTTKITLSDENLASVKDEDNFSLLDHVAVGDQVQIILNQSSAYYQEGNTVEINLLEGEGYVGPYKVIYSEAITSSTASNMYVILSGPGNLVLVTIPLNRPGAGIDISEPKRYPGDYTAFALKTGEIAYYDPINKQTFYIADIPDFSRSDNALAVKTSPEAMSFRAQAIASSEAFEKDEDGNYRITVKAENIQDSPLVNQHSNWYSFGTAAGPNDEEGSEASPRSASDVEEEDLRDMNTTGIATKSPPAVIVSSIPYNNGYLNFDSKDRIYFEDADDEVAAETNWMSYPDKLEYFEINERPGAFSITEPGKRKEFIAVDAATDIDLRNFIRRTLKEMFSNYAGVDDTIDEKAISSGEIDIEKLQALVNNKTSIFQFNTDTGSAADMASIALARLLSGKTGAKNETWNLDSDAIYVPNLREIDVPVYFRRDEEPKWIKSYVAESSTGTTLDNANLKTLQAFARALLPVKYVTREASGISNYSKNKKNLVLWDQDTATVSIMDKIGKLKQRIAIEDLALDHPVLLNQVIKNDRGELGAPAAYSYSNSLYCYSSTADLINYIKSTERANPITINNIQYNIYSIFGLNFGSSGAVINYDNSAAPLYLPRILADITSKNWEAIPDLIANIDEIKELLNIATNVADYQKWLQNCVILDFMTAAVSEYEAFKDLSYALNIPLLHRIFTYVPGYSEQKAYLENVMQLTTFSQDAILTKGLPYFTVDTAEQPEYVSARLSAVPVLPESTRNFESIIATSNIEVTDNYAHIYGTIVWPDLNEVKNRISSTLLKNYSGGLKNVSMDMLDQIVDSYATTISLQLQDKYVTFTGSTNYRANRETSFKISIDLLTGNISKTQIDSEALEDANILSIATKSSENIVITNKGQFALGSEDSTIMSPDAEDISKFDSEIRVGTKLLVFEGLKASKMFTDLDLDSAAVLKLKLEGTLVNNPEVFYSNISFASEKELKIQSDTIILGDGDVVTATVLVKNLTKDNFQYGFGQVENLSTIPAAWSLFEVASAKFADFATYSNKSSLANFDKDLGLYTKPDVFDLYPTFEQVDENKRKDFYKLSVTNGPTYLKNALGRHVIRLSNMPDSASSGRIIAMVDPQDYKDIFIGRYETEEEPYTEEELAKVPKQSIAREWITLDFLTKVAGTSSVRVNKVVLPEARVIGKDYTTITKSYSVQKIPVLVDDPWKAVLEKPFKSFELDVSKANNTLLGEDYIVADFDLSTKEVLDFSEALNEKVFNANKAQAQQIDESYQAVEANVSLVALDLKIVHPSETLPKLVPISKFRAETLENGNLKIATKSHELHIPAKGYGQALLGNYTLPKDCLFEENIFYDYDKFTVNEDGENFVLVQEDGTLIASTAIPKMVYKSFAQANQALPQELATRDAIQLDELLIDLSKFEVGYKSFSCKKLQDLNFLDFSGDFIGVGNATNYRIYEIFKSNLKFSCKALYSLLPKDPEAVGVINLSTCDIKNPKYSNNQLVDSLGYTRCYNQLLLPANIKYKYKDGTYKTTVSAFFKKKDVFNVDQYGNLLYLDSSGKPVTQKTINPEPLLSTRTSDIIRLFEVSDSKVESFVQNCFYYTKNGIFAKKNSNSLAISSDSQYLRSLIAITDPTTAPQMYTTIQDITGDELSWNSETSFRFIFKNPEKLQVTLNFEKTQKNNSYNIAYLRDKLGNLVAKVFFENSVDSNSLIIFQKEV